MTDMALFADVAPDDRSAVGLSLPPVKTVTIFGLGYIGLPTAALMASRGLSVLGVDIRQEVIDGLANGLHEVVEPGLDNLVKAAIRSKALRVSMVAETSDVFIIAVPTPLMEDRSPDLRSVFAVCEAMAPLLREDNLVLIESTVPVGTTERVSRYLAALRPDLTFPTDSGTSPDVRIAYCPERVHPSCILPELMANARCIGGLTSACGRSARDFYQLFVSGDCVVTGARTSEMVKLAENAYRDVNIAFANELATICDRQDIDVWDVIDLANRHPRVSILRPGPGVGGHCIAVDPWFIVHSARDHARLIRTAREVNDKRTEDTFEHAVALVERNPHARIVCLGLAFKADVDDLRGSPALDVTVRLARRYPGRITVVEPHIKVLPSELQELNVALATLADALRTCDVAIVLVDHDQFLTVPASDRARLAILDTRGIWRDVAS